MKKEYAFQDDCIATLNMLLATKHSMHNHSDRRFGQKVDRFLRANGETGVGGWADLARK